MSAGCKSNKELDIKVLFPDAAASERSEMNSLVNSNFTPLSFQLVIHIISTLPNIG